MMATIIDGLCFIILGTCIMGGLVFLYGGMDDKKPASVLMGAAFFFLGILFDGFIYFIYTELSSSVFSLDNRPVLLLFGCFLGEFFFSLIALVRSMLGKTEEAPEKSEDIPSDLEGRVEYWHTYDTGNTLQEFLGMTDSEYEKWGRGEYNPAAEDNEKEDK